MIIFLTDRMLFKLQTSEMGFLRQFRSVALRNKLRSCAIPNTLNVEFFSLRRYGQVSKISPDRLVRQDFLAKPKGNLPRGGQRTRCSDYIYRA